MKCLKSLEWIDGDFKKWTRYSYLKTNETNHVTPGKSHLINPKRE